MAAARELMRVRPIGPVEDPRLLTPEERWRRYVELAVAIVLRSRQQQSLAARQQQGDGRGA